MTPEEQIALQPMFSTSIPIADVAEEQQKTAAALESLDRLTAISTFAAMLASPWLQANAYRLEALVHIAAIRAAGQQVPSAGFIARAFNRCGSGICGRLEDPAEDVFSTSVYCDTGNYVIFEGLREGNGFYLQRVLDVMAEMPTREPFASYRRSVRALLTLSDIVARRAGVLARIVYQSEPLSALPIEIVTDYVDVALSLPEPCWDWE